jgi:hypothetical protein
MPVLSIEFEFEFEFELRTVGCVGVCSTCPCQPFANWRRITSVMSMNVLFPSTSFYFLSTLYMLTVTTHSRVKVWVDVGVFHQVQMNFLVDFIPERWQEISFPIQVNGNSWSFFYFYSDVECTWQNWSTPTIFSLHLFIALLVYVECLCIGYCWAVLVLLRLSFPWHRPTTNYKEKRSNESPPHHHQ